MSDYMIYKASDNSGFVVYNKFTGETIFSLDLSDLKLTNPNNPLIFLEQDFITEQC
jgi:hypothetical protein